VIKLNINEGFQINSPDVFVPWTITQNGLKKLLREYGLKHVTMGYFAISCVSLGDMDHELGFHFSPPTSNRLSELEFFRKAYPDRKRSYDTFQSYFEKEFGKPTETHPGPEGFNTCIWEMDSIEISHCVYDRFGPEEHMRIRRIPGKGFSVIRSFHTTLSYFAKSRSMGFTILRALGFLIVFLIALPVILLFMIYVVAYSLLRPLWINSLRRINGKTPKLYCLSKECMKWSHGEALTAAKKAVIQYELLVKQTDTECTSINHKLAQEVLVMIEKESASKKGMYDLCRRIREAPKIKGVDDVYLLHDWLLERADNAEDR